jgi:hypothetical protein
MSPGKDEMHVRGDLIRKVFDQLNFLSQTFKELMIERLEADGMTLDARHKYTLKEIEKSLSALFGRDAAELIIKKMLRGLAQADQVAHKQ